jgi:V/A-type H+-transporting ATPase subunit I
MDIFREAKHARTSVTSENWQSLAKSSSSEISRLKNETDGLTMLLKNLHEEKSGLQRLSNMLANLEAMGADLRFFERMRAVYLAIASVPRKNLYEFDKALGSFPVVFHHCLLTKEVEFVCVALSMKHREEAVKILKTHHAEILEIPEDMPKDLSKAKEEVATQIKETMKKEETILESLRKLATSNRSRLLVLRETTQNLLNSLHAKKKFLYSDKLVTIRGFVSKSEFSKLAEKVNRLLNGKVIVLKNIAIEGEDPPTVFRNHRFIKPFEEITKLYGLPHYDELDPTPIIAISFPLIFGLMFGDFGHGIVLLTGGLFFRKIVKGREGLKNFLGILAACGMGAIISGLLFGEFFGKQVFPPVWFDPFNNVTQFLLFSLVIGTIQISTGLVLDLANSVLQKKIVDALLVSLPKLAFYAGSIYLVIVYRLDFGAWFRGPILFALIPFVFMILGKPLSAFVSRMKLRSEGRSAGQNSFMQSFFESSDLVTRFLSNTISYTRILALLMAHWALLLVTYVVSSIFAGSSVIGLVVAGMIIIGGNAFVIAFEGLIVFIHALRLHFYEWFSKFYQGTGTPFVPFKQSHVFTEIVYEEKLQV